MKLFFLKSKPRYRNVQTCTFYIHFHQPLKPLSREYLVHFSSMREKPSMFRSYKSNQWLKWQHRSALWSHQRLYTNYLLTVVAFHNHLVSTCRISWKNWNHTFLRFKLHVEIACLVCLDIVSYSSRENSLAHLLEMCCSISLMTFSTCICYSPKR